MVAAPSHSVGGGIKIGESPALRQPTASCRAVGAAQGMGDIGGSVFFPFFFITAPPWCGLLWRTGAGRGIEPPPAGSSHGALTTGLHAHPRQRVSSMAPQGTPLLFVLPFFLITPQTPPTPHTHYFLLFMGPSHEGSL